MKQFNVRISLLLALLLACAPAMAKKQELPEYTEDGLKLIPDTKMAIVYADPDATLEGYDQVQLLDAFVAFKKNWARDQRSRSAQPLRINSKDIEDIKTSLSELFGEVFRKELDEAGYTVTDEAGENVLLIRPAIINLDVNAPDTPGAGRSYSYTSSAGEMTLYLELFDSVTGDIIAKSLDRRVDNAFHGSYTWTNSVTNRAAAERILKGWAKVLTNALDEAHSGTKSSED